MTVLQAIILGVVQGLTEFIPVSSSGHLVLIHNLLGLQQNGLAFDVALHMGTLGALIILFYKDIYELFISLFKRNSKTKLAWLLILATIPAVIAGILLQSLAETKFRSVVLVSISMIIIALIMLYAEWYSKNKTNKTNLQNIKTDQAVTMGLAQAIAIIPGVSRSGVTITAGLFAGINRISATRFSFLLAIPITFGAILKIFISSGTINQINTQPSIFIIGILSAFISGVIAIKFMLKYLSKHTLNIFAYYRIVVAIVAIFSIWYW